MAVTGSNRYDAGTATWTRPADCELVEVVVLAGGGSGGQGGQWPAGQYSLGGSGGGGGGLTRVFLHPTDAGATRDIVVGAGAASPTQVATTSSIGANGLAGTRSRFGTSDAAALAYAAGGGGGLGGWNQGNAQGGNGGYGTWQGGGGDGWSGVQGIGTPMFVTGGGGGGYLDNGSFVGGGRAGRWSLMCSKDTSHPPQPAGGVPSQYPTPPYGAGTAGAGVNGLARTFLGSCGGGGGAHATSLSGWGNTGTRGSGGAGGGGDRNGSTAGNGNIGGDGLAVIISHGIDTETHAGSMRGAVALTVSVTGTKVATPGTTRVPAAVTAQATGVKRISGAVNAPVVALARVTGGEPAPPIIGYGVVLGTVTGTKRTTGGAMRAPLAVIAHVQGGRHIYGAVHASVVVLARVKAGRFYVLTGPTNALYLARASSAVYHHDPSRALYLPLRTRALYDSGVPELLPWMAGQRRGSIRAQLVDANGPINGLAAAVGVRFTARRQSDGQGLVDVAATIEDATNAIVRYDPGADELDVPGKYDVQWVIIHEGSLPQYVPDSGYDQLDALAPLTTFTP